MMIRAHHCAHARPRSSTMSPPFVLCFRHTSRRCRRWAHGRPPRAFTRRKPYISLCTRSEKYIELICLGIGLSQGAADTARRQGAGLSLNTQLVVSLLSKVLWVGLSLTSSRMRRLLVSYRPLACAWVIDQVPSAYRDGFRDNRVGDEVWPYLVRAYFIA